MLSILIIKVTGSNLRNTLILIIQILWIEVLTNSSLLSSCPRGLSNEEEDTLNPKQPSPVWLINFTYALLSISPCALSTKYKAGMLNRIIRSQMIFFTRYLGALIINPINIMIKPIPAIKIEIKLHKNP